MPTQTSTRQPAPPLIERINNGNWLPREEAEALRDELFYQRAIHAYMLMQPALNTIGVRDGSLPFSVNDAPRSRIRRTLCSRVHSLRDYRRRAPTPAPLECLRVPCLKLCP